MKKKSKLDHKIARRIILIGTVTFAIIFFASLAVFLPQLNENAVQNVQTTTTQVVDQVDYFLSYIKDYSNTLTMSEELKESYAVWRKEPNEQNYQKVCLALNSLSNRRTNIRGIIMEIDDGTRFDSIGLLTETDFEQLDKDWYRILQNADFAGGFSAIYPFDSGQGKTLYSAAYAKNYYLQAGTVTLTCIFTTSEVSRATNNLSQGNLDAYMWTNGSSEVFVASDNTEWQNEAVSYLKENSIDEGQFDGMEGLNFVSSSSESGWQFVSYISNQTIALSFADFLIPVILMLIIFYALIILLITPVVRKTIQPVGMLASTMKQVSQGKLELSANIDTNDEISELSEIFNSMLESIRNHMAEMLKRTEKEQQMKYSLLVSQMDPHFIYNTMNSINYLIRKGRDKDAILVNTALIAILQDTLRINDIEIMDTLQNEIKIVKRYLEILSVRYSGDVNVKWDIDEELMEKPIPKNMIQPLIENAILHGLAQDNGEYRGNIIITGKRERGMISISVCDDGRGVNEDVLKNLDQAGIATRKGDRGKHIGLDNIRQRLAYLYGSIDCMEIMSRAGQGTIVTLHFPSE